VLAAALALLAAGVGSNDAARAQPQVVAFGDSYVDPGLGVRQGQRPWLPLLGGPVRNLGHPGDGVAAALHRVRRAGTSFDVVIVEVGINDVRRHGAGPDQLASFRRDFGAVLDRLASAQRVVVVPPLPIRSWGPRGSESVLLAYREAEADLAASHPNVVVADPVGLWRPEVMLLPDGIHPNASGRALIVTAVRAALAAEHRA
jgi:lysophospholipase L1-like esterase